MMPDAKAAGAKPSAVKPAEAYTALPAVPDEMVGPDGKLRPLWRDFATAFAALSPEDIGRRTARAEQYLRDSGVFYRQYGGGESVERPWPLAPIPVLIAESDWADLAPGLIQRAELLEALMADLYGENRMVAGGHLPPVLVAANPEWLRPMVARMANGGFWPTARRRPPVRAMRWKTGSPPHAPSTSFTRRAMSTVSRAFSATFAMRCWGCGRTVMPAPRS
jgi:hypothetical protein